MDSLDTQRQFLRSDLWSEWDALETDQRKGLPAPPPEKPCPPGAALIDLVAPDDLAVGKMPLVEAIRRRRSHRQYAEAPLTLEELSFLLWATQGVREVRHSEENVTTFRSVPSAGSRHPFETYLLVNRVGGLEPGLYRYLPLEHKLCFLRAEEGLAERVHEACYQQYVTNSAVTFIWTAIPYRTEWRYSLLACKVIAIDVGHLCQNLYLACESIGAGTCAIGAYDQNRLDAALGVDGAEEFAIYVATVGKIE